MSIKRIAIFNFFDVAYLHLSSSEEAKKKKEAPAYQDCPTIHDHIDTMTLLN